MEPFEFDALKIIELNAIYISTEYIFTTCIGLVQGPTCHSFEKIGYVCCMH